jgi:hypothetical protein
MAASSKQGRIRRLIEQTDALPDKEMRAWKERARFAVAAVYGDESAQVKRFDKIRWNLAFWSDSTPSSAFRDAERQGLRRSVELLQAVLEDLEEQERARDLPGIDPADFHPWVAEPAAVYGKTVIGVRPFRQLPRLLRTSFGRRPVCTKGASLPSPLRPSPQTNLSRVLPV